MSYSELEQMQAKARKLLEALAEACETRGDAEHAWRRCRHCLATAELEGQHARQLVQVALDQLDLAASLARIRHAKRQRYLEKRANTRGPARATP